MVQVSTKIPVGPNIIRLMAGYLKQISHGFEEKNTERIATTKKLGS